MSSSQPVFVCQKRTHQVFRRTHRGCCGTQRALSCETVLSKQYSARFLLKEVGPKREDYAEFLLITQSRGCRGSLDFQCGNEWATHRAGESETRPTSGFTSGTTSGPTSGPTSAPTRSPTTGPTRVDFPVFSLSRTPTKCPTKASTEVPTKVSSRVVEVHLSCFHVFCSSANEPPFFQSLLSLSALRTMRSVKRVVFLGQRASKWLRIVSYNGSSKTPWLQAP